MAIGSDFRRLWAAYAVSEAGSAVAFGALPLVAILVPARTGVAGLAARHSSSRSISSLATAPG